MSFLRPLDEQKAVQELEEWHTSMLKLQSLVLNGNWENDTSKILAELLCEDMVRRMEECISRLSLSVNKAVAGVKHQLDHSNRTVSASCMELDKSIRISEKKPRLEESNKRKVKQIVTANLNDGHPWRKHGRKETKGFSSLRHYYKCAHEDCTGKKHVQRIDGTNPANFQITYYEDHSCGAFTLPDDGLICSEFNAELVISETQGEGEHVGSEFAEPVQEDVNADPFVMIVNESEQQEQDKGVVLKEQEPQDACWYLAPPNVQEDGFILKPQLNNQSLGWTPQTLESSLSRSSAYGLQSSAYSSSSGYGSSSVSPSAFGLQSAYGNLSVSSATSSKADVELPDIADILEA